MALMSAGGMGLSWVVQRAHQKVDKMELRRVDKKGHCLENY